MNLLMRAAFVLGGIFLGINLINYFILGHTGGIACQAVTEWATAVGVRKTGEQATVDRFRRMADETGMPVVTYNWVP